MTTMVQHNAGFSGRRAFPRRLRSLQRAANLSQADLARLVFTSQPTVSKWMCGRATPDLDHLCALADLFETSTDDLLGRGGG